MNKPITVAEHEFRNNLTDLINVSGLPLFIIEYSINKILVDVRAGANRQLEDDARNYKAAVAQEAASNNALN